MLGGQTIQILEFTFHCQGCVLSEPFSLTSCHPNQTYISHHIWKNVSRPGISLSSQWSLKCIIVLVSTLALDLLRCSEVEELRGESPLSAGCEKSLFSKLDDRGLEPSPQPSYHRCLQRAWRHCLKTKLQGPTHWHGLISKVIHQNVSEGRGHWEKWKNSSKYNFTV